MSRGLDGFIERNFAIAMCYAASVLTQRLVDAGQDVTNGLPEPTQTILGEQVHDAMTAFFNSPPASPIDDFRMAIERAAKAAFVRL